jgi:hypothetical protein
MNWYKKSQSNSIEFGIEGLRAEARKYNSFEEFEHAWMGEIKHGLYWHITYDKNFQIDPEKGPRDTSSMGNARMDKGKLMITSHLEYWADSYMDDDLTGGNPREYAAAIDMSNVPANQYRQVNRGFGNEFFVEDPSQAKVIAVFPIKEALMLDAQFDKEKPQNRQSLKDLYDQEHALIQTEQPATFIDTDNLDNNELV